MFVVLVTVVLTNLLVGLAVSDIQVKALLKTLFKSHILHILCKTVLNLTIKIC